MIDEAISNADETEYDEVFCLIAAVIDEEESHDEITQEILKWSRKLVEQDDEQVGWNRSKVKALVVDYPELGPVFLDSLV